MPQAATIGKQVASTAGMPRWTSTAPEMPPKMAAKVRKSKTAKPRRCTVFERWLTRVGRPQKRMPKM